MPDRQASKTTVILVTLKIGITSTVGNSNLKSVIDKITKQFHENLKNLRLSRTFECALCSDAGLIRLKHFVSIFLLTNRYFISIMFWGVS